MRTLLLMILSFLLISCQSEQTDALQDKTFQTLKVFPQPLVIEPVDMINKKGEKTNIHALKGNYSVIFFGFTNCPDICPTTLLDMQKINKKLISAGHPSPQFVFISVDPERDTAATLEQYIGYFNPDFKALTAEPENLQKLAAQLGVAFRVEPHEAGIQVYNVDHTAAWFVLNEDANRIGIFTTPHEVDVITADLIKLME